MESGMKWAAIQGTAVILVQVPAASGWGWPWKTTKKGWDPASRNTDCFIQNIDYALNDVDQFHGIESARECQMKCQTIPACLFFSYVPETAPAGGKG